MKKIILFLSIIFYNDTVGMDHGQQQVRNFDLQNINTKQEEASKKIVEHYQSINECFSKFGVDLKIEFQGMNFLTSSLSQSTHISQPNHNNPTAITKKALGPNEFAAIMSEIEQKALVLSSQKQSDDCMIGNILAELQNSNIPDNQNLELSSNSNALEDQKQKKNVQSGNLQKILQEVTQQNELIQQYKNSTQSLQTTIQQQIQDLLQQQTAQQDQLQQSQEKDDNSQEAESETQEAQNDESQKSLVPEQIQDEQQQEIQQIQSDQQQYQNQYQQKLNELRTQGEKDNNESIKQLFEIIKLQQERINKLRTQTLELTKQKNDFRIVAHNAEKKINELLDEESEEASQQ